MTTTFSIWYMRPDFFSRGISGERTTDLAATHVHLRDLTLPGGEAQLQRVFDMQQGEMWSPNGEARPLIEAKGLQHTSMSVGDVVVINHATFMNNEAYVVASLGFELLDLTPSQLRAARGSQHSEPHTIPADDAPHNNPRMPGALQKD